MRYQTESESDDPGEWKKSKQRSGPHSVSNVSEETFMINDSGEMSEPMNDVAESTLMVRHKLERSFARNFIKTATCGTQINIK